MKSHTYITGIADEAAAGIHDQIACHRALGWHHMELRSVDGIALSKLSQAQQDAMCAALSAAGIAVPVIDSQIGNWSRSIADPFDDDLSELTNLLELAGRTGTRMIRVMSYPNARNALWPQADWSTEVIRRLRILSDMAGAQGVTLVHENCAGWGGSSIAQALHLVEAVADHHFRLLFDIGNGLSYGYSALEYLKKLLPWISHIHLKDGLVSGGKVVYSMPGEGSAELLPCLRYLSEHHYSGGYSIEPHLHLIPHLRIAPENSTLMQSTYISYARKTEALLAQVEHEMNGAFHVI